MLLDVFLNLLASVKASFFVVAMSQEINQKKKKRNYCLAFQRGGRIKVLSSTVLLIDRNKIFV